MTDEEILQREAEEEDKRPHDDYCWTMHNDEVRAGFGGRGVVVNKRQVWGAGDDPLEALADALAKPGSPDRLKYVFVSVPLTNSDSLTEEYFQPGHGIKFSEVPEEYRSKPKR